MSRSRIKNHIDISYQKQSLGSEKTGKIDTAGYERKIQSLLDTNRLLARENQFLSQQSDMLRKEHDALGHLMRSRIALSNVKEMELKSALEGMRAVVQEKENFAVALEKKYEELLSKMKALEDQNEENLADAKETKDNDMRINSIEGRHEIKRLSKQFIAASSAEGHQRPISVHGESTDGMTEALHPWLSPVLLRLESLEKSQDASFEALCGTRVTPTIELNDIGDAEGGAQYCGLDDATSCTDDCKTPQDSPQGDLKQKTTFYGKYYRNTMNEEIEQTELESGIRYVGTRLILC